MFCKMLIRGNRNVTSNFVKHLRLKHPENYNTYKYKSISSSSGSRSLEELQDDTFDNRVMTYIIDSVAPVSTVEKASFRNMFKGTGLRVMSRPKLMKKLDQRFKRMITNIKDLLATSKYFCTTADVWSTKHRSFFGYTCHWLDNNFQRKSVALACKRFSGEHSYEHILDMISNINSEFKLNHSNIVATVTDNGSNFVKAFKEFGIENMNVSDQSLDDHEAGFDDNPECVQIFQCNNTLPKHVRCASHTLNLLASSDFHKIINADDLLKNRHKQIFKKCSLLWRKCSWPKSSEIIAQTLGASLIPPVVTRWNSMFDAISRLLLHKEKLEDVFDKLGLTQHNKFSLTDIQYLEEYSILMSPIAATLDFLQREDNLVYGCLIPSLVTLSVKLRKISISNDMSYLKAVAIRMEKSLRDRFSHYFALDSRDAIIASVLCPKIKMRWFNALAKISPVSYSMDDIHKMVIAEATRHLRVDGEIDVSVTSDSNNQDDFFDFGDIDDLDREPNEIAQSTSAFCLTNPDHSTIVADQFYKYLNDKETEVEMLQKYPLLKNVSLKMNTPLTSSAPVERLFSLANILNNPRRQGLTDFSFEKLVLMKANYIHIEDKKNHIIDTII